MMWETIDKQNKVSAYWTDGLFAFLGLAEESHIIDNGKK
jgi:hypothetical protein